MFTKDWIHIIFLSLEKFECKRKKNQKKHKIPIGESKENMDYNLLKT